ncbi:MAG: hypothetical protein NC483_00560 [Ruminococcus sp.]|nr:hypothetical protein [Ruminococcus sp.]
MTRQEFYQTKAWKQVRKNIWLKQSCLCARCHRPVYVNGISDYVSKDKRLKGIVHHKEYLTDVNFNDINISLNENNLEGVCIDCHNVEHFTASVTRNDLTFDVEGNIILKENPPT